VDSLYNWIVFLHILGAFTFVLAHGVAAGVSLKLREERELPRVQALLELSNTATQGMYVGLVILLIGGITAGFMAGLWGRGWIWTALALLVAMIAFMFARASRYYGEVRRAAGLAYYIPLTRSSRRSRSSFELSTQSQSLGSAEKTRSGLVDSLLAAEPLVARAFSRQSGSGAGRRDRQRCRQDR